MLKLKKPIQIPKTRAEKAKALLPLAALGVVRAEKAEKKLVSQLAQKADAKRLQQLGLLAGGAVAAAVLLTLAGRYTFYRGVVSRELKKQLAPLNRKLDELQEELDEMKETEEDKKKKR